MNNTLYFEGAGMRGTGSQELPNCRIRTAFKTNDQKIIYLELVASEITTYAKKSGARWAFMGSIGEYVCFINHCFYIDNENESSDENETGIHHLWNKIIKYDKSNLLKYINEHFNCNYNDIMILNDTNYYVHKNNGGYNLMDNYKHDEKIEEMHRELKEHFKNEDKKHLNKKYSNLSYMRDFNNKNKATILIHYNGFNDYIYIDDITSYKYSYTFK